jgi:hypothetical protein
MPVLVLIAVIVGVAVWFALSPNSTPSAEPAPAVTSAPSPTPPSATPTPSESPTERPLLTADESLTAELGRGYELRDDRGNTVPVCEATRFVAAYNPYVGAPQPGNSFTLRTTEGPIDITPYANDVDGYRGVISASC